MGSHHRQAATAKHTMRNISGNRVDVEFMYSSDGGRRAAACCSERGEVVLADQCLRGRLHERGVERPMDHPRSVVFKQPPPVLVRNRQQTFPQMAHATGANVCCFTHAARGGFCTCMCGRWHRGARGTCRGLARPRLFAPTQQRIPETKASPAKSAKDRPNATEKQAINLTTALITIRMDLRWHWYSTHARMRVTC